MEICYSPAILNWLESILCERFGHGFSLTSSASGLTLRAAGLEGEITFDVFVEYFREVGSDLPFCRWDACAEGWVSPLGGCIPAPGASHMPVPLIAQTVQGLHVHYDILGLTYWMLSRQEEVGRTDLDAHARFPATSSHAYRHGYLERPVVDEWLNVLGQAIQRVWPKIVINQHEFGVKVSHDVDAPSRYGFASIGGLVRGMCGDVFKRGDLVGAIRAAWLWKKKGKVLEPRDPFNTFKWIMDLSERYGLISAFYFICGHTDPHDADYSPEDLRIRNLMKEIHARGHEIGLHPSYQSYLNPEMIRREAELLRRLCAAEGIKQSKWGGRMHYLRWEQPTTLRAWAAAGMSYDSTLGYADRPGFRCGTCFEYSAFDPVAQEELPLRVRPLVLMECSLIEKRYLGLGTSQSALDKALALKDACRRVGGTFTLLWHNSSLRTVDYKTLYESVIAERRHAL